MYRYTERGVSKFFLIHFNEKQLSGVAKAQNLPIEQLHANYLYEGEGVSLGILEVAYSHTAHSKPPKDGKLRKVRPAYNWLTLRDERLHPKLDAPHATPLRCNWVYSSDD